MTVNYTTNLALGQPVTGTESGTWGDDVNNSVTSYLDIAIAGGLAITITTADVTLANTLGDSSATNISSTTAQYAILNISGAKTAARNLNLPISSKWYIINNSAATGGFALTVRGVTPTTGITLVDGEKAVVAWNGSDYVKIASSVLTNFTGILPVANGGTGLTAGTSGGVLYYSAAGTLASSTLLTQYGVIYGGGSGAAPVATAAGTTGQVLTATTGSAPSWAAPATNGTVTSVGWTGGIVSIATATTTPAFTIAGTSGGIPYFSSGTTWATSAALAANSIVLGGGAGAAPATTTTGTGVVTALGTNVGSAGAVVVNGGALGTPSSGTVTNLTGTASININGTVGATTANTGKFTSITNTGLTTGRVVYTTTGGLQTSSANLLYSGTDLTVYDITVGRGGSGVYTDTAVGNAALSLSGGNNTSIGAFTLNGQSATGNANTAVGAYAMFFNDTGSKNTAIGVNALYTNTTGSYNVAIGGVALDSCNGSGNTAINPYTSTGSNSPVFSITSQDNRISMGSTAVTNAYIQVAWTVVSDARDKTDFAEMPHGLDFVNKLKPTAYRYKENREAIEGHGPLRYGFKAQDVLALEGDTPVIVDADNPEKLYFNDQSMIAVLVKAIQELKAEFDAYKLTHP